MRPIEEALQFDPSTIFSPLSHFCNLIPGADELFKSIFHSFEAGIGNAISSFRKIFNIYLMKNRYRSPKLTYWIN